MESDVDHAPGRLPREAAGRATRPPPARFAFFRPSRATGLKPHFLDKLAANGVVLPPSFFTTDDTSAPAVGPGHKASKFKGAFQ